LDATVRGIAAAVDRVLAAPPSPLTPPMAPDVSFAEELLAAYEDAAGSPGQRPPPG
jgi:hypothetical protein